MKSNQLPLVFNLIGCIAVFLSIPIPQLADAQGVGEVPLTGRNSLMFTTMVYQNAALWKVIAEANAVAKALHLPENLPITESNIVGCYITPYGMTQIIKAVGNVTTSNYTYCVSVGNKFSYVESVHQDADIWRWYHEYSWPISRLDTNAAYQLATQWLDAVSMDVKGLNADCDVHVVPSALRGQGTNAVFLPVYWVFWTKGGLGHGSIASVEVFAPTKALMQLRVEDSEYILRKRLEFTNLEYLLSPY